MHQHSKIQLQMGLPSVILRNSMSKKPIFLIEIMIVKRQLMHGWMVAPQHREGQVKGD